MKWKVLFLILILLLPGCARISPFNPELENKINNQDGEIDDIKNNQNGFMLDLIDLENRQELNARDIENIQQGIINQNNENSGIQILQGDGGLIFAFGLITIFMILIFHYRSRARKSEKAAEIFAQQIANHSDLELENEIFLSAMNSEVEEEVYKLMVKNQANRRNRIPVE